MEPDREPPRRGRESHPATRRVRELKVPKAQKGRWRRANAGGRRHANAGGRVGKKPLCRLHITEPRWSLCHLVTLETEWTPPVSTSTTEPLTLTRSKPVLSSPTNCHHSFIQSSTPSGTQEGQRVAAEATASSHSQLGCSTTPPLLSS